ncbi:hypothetical protein TrLO_g12719 [Triparma laevis f. longispina]|uniref:Uncharacterized protein n=1 Tax=Triparma laevis f. longispina TaxID=1714387 RepID=A0A9W7A425_9STRA|nr:hypothetical protein TrLO_g12719 [Triparma laevis f. longispina]
MSEDWANFKSSDDCFGGFSEPNGGNEPNGFIDPNNFSEPNSFSVPNGFVEPSNLTAPPSPPPDEENENDWARFSHSHGASFISVDLPKISSFSSDSSNSEQNGRQAFSIATITLPSPEPEPRSRSFLNASINSLSLSTCSSSTQNSTPFTPEPHLTSPILLNYLLIHLTPYLTLTDLGRLRSVSKLVERSGESNRKRLEGVVAMGEGVGERLRVEFWRRCLDCDDDNILQEPQTSTSEDLNKRVTFYTNLIHKDTVLPSVSTVSAVNNTRINKNDNKNDNSFQVLDVCECDEGGEWEVDLDNVGFEFCVLCGTDRRIGEVKNTRKEEGREKMEVETVLNSPGNQPNEKTVNKCIKISCTLCSSIISARGLKGMWGDGREGKFVKALMERVKECMPRLLQHLKEKDVELTEFAEVWIESVGASYGFVEVEMLKFVYDCFISTGWNSLISTAAGVLEVLENTIIKEEEKGSIEEILKAPLNEMLWSETDFREVIMRRIRSSNETDEWMSEPVEGGGEDGGGE